VNSVELRDRSIVITGAGSGIGRALAHRFAAEQPRAQILADINAEAVQQVAREIDAIAVQCDVGVRDEVLALIGRAHEQAGPIDLFFSNAGIAGPSGGPVGLGNEEWDASWRVLRGMRRVLREVRESSVEPHAQERDHV